MVYSKIFPIVYIYNGTDSIIKEVYLRFEGMKGNDIVFKNIKCNSVKSETIITTGAKGYKKLVMYYYDDYNNNHEDIIFDKLLWGYNKDIKINIIGINEDNSYKLNIKTDIVES